jgi:hypothetical protein
MAKVSSKPSGRSNPEAELAFVALLHALINLPACRRSVLFENRGQRRARVFRIDIDSSGENRLLANKSSRQIETPLYGQMSASFDDLSEQFSKDELLGEILGSNHNAIGLLGNLTVRSKSGKRRRRIKSVRMMGK